jgi:hypothetical protein
LPLKLKKIFLWIKNALVVFILAYLIYLDMKIVFSFFHWCILSVFLKMQVGLEWKADVFCVEWFCGLTGCVISTWKSARCRRSQRGLGCFG